MKKKLLLALLLLVFCSACGAKEESKASPFQKKNSSAVQSPTVQDLLEEPQEEPAPSDAPAPPPPAPPSNPPVPPAESKNKPEKPQKSTVNPSQKIDVDLSAMSDTVVYGEVYNMLYRNPEAYIGKTVKMTGMFNTYQLIDEDGNTVATPLAYSCIITDATACCAEGIEFVPPSGMVYPKDFPELGTNITVIGTFESYMQEDFPFYHLVNTTFSLA